MPKVSSDVCCGPVAHTGEGAQIPPFTMRTGMGTVTLEPEEPEELMLRGIPKLTAFWRIVAPGDCIGVQTVGD